ncbi:MAG: response regulator [Zoogloeaceae bacterium]|nr:response regulator [Zoogloeaceae bacterium]MCK6383903.1 ATP-binding protein [Rhodocyclaceae bacterium]
MDVRARGAALAWAVLALLLPHALRAEPATFFEADFVYLEGAGPPHDDAPWQRQALPDDWRRTRPAASGSGWYRLKASLGADTQRMHALYVPRGGDQIEVFVNGVLLGRTGGKDDSPVLTWKRPQLFAIAPARLREGENSLHIRVWGRSGNQSGLSPLRFGLEEELRGEYWRRFALQTVGPVALAAALGLIGVFFLVLWGRRRQDAMYALFAAASLLWAARNVIDLLYYQAIPQPHWEIWLALLYQAFVALLCLFAVRFAGERLPRYERLLLASLPASLAAYYALLPWVPAQATTRVGLLFALALAAVPAYAIGRAALRSREGGTVMMAVVGAVSLAFGAYDWLGSFRPQMFDSIRLMPYLALFFTTTAGWLLIHRFGEAYGDLERLNAELDRRVEEKSAELRINLEHLDSARARAEEANRAKSRFLAAASHDLRQPLHALGLFAVALRGEVSLPHTRDLVGKIGRCVDDLEKMFGELMDISRIDAGTVAAKICDFPLQGLFDRLRADFQPLAGEKRLRLRFRPTRVWVRSDPLMFERILRNLLSNALRYTERGSVLVACRARGETLWIEVRDSGIGIPPAEQARIFEEFHQVGNPERDRSKGVGLGLSIVRRLAELLGEKVALRSAPGRGATFRFSARRAQPGAAPAAGQVQTGDAGLHGEPLLVALLEDDFLSREAMTRLLEQQGARVVAGRDVPELIVRLQAAARPPDLILADYQLRGGESGVAAARVLRQMHGAAIPAILVTGQTSEERLAEAKASGLPILRKPIKGGKLLALIRAVLAKEETTGG